MRLRLSAAVVVLATAARAVAAQEKPAAVKLDLQPAAVNVAYGDSVRLVARALDANGNEVPTPLVFFSLNRDAVSASRDGWVKGKRGGTYKVLVGSLENRALRGEVAVTVAYPPIKAVALGPAAARIYVGAKFALDAKVTDLADVKRDDAALAWSSSNPAVAAVDANGVVTARRPGAVTFTAAAGGVKGTIAYTVVPNTIRELRLTASAVTGRTGDVLHFTAAALDARGRELPDAPVTFSVAGAPEDTVIAQFAAAEIDAKGRFVAQKAGKYVVVVSAAGQTAQQPVTITNRNVTQVVKLVGRSSISDKHTSDLYVWQGKDGRDYMVAGMWGAGGQAYFYDVTDPAHQVLLDSIVVDARTVNDVYVDETGTICVLTREGASNRKNGLVIVDCTDPRHPRVLANFDDGLYGGVHNVNIWKHYLFAINAGTRFDIIDIADPRNPKRLSYFELPTEGHAIHDVWVVDGIAYASQWKDGVILVDVGNGKYGGSPEHPKQFASYAYPLGATHAAYPYKSPTGKFYVITGDEIFPYGLNVEAGSAPVHTAGYAHIIDFTDPLHPEEVARYEVPEAGSHNFWVEGDRLYAGFYEGGLRVVDLSGELKGNLYYQGREIARFQSYDPKGMIANAPFNMGAQLYKGNIFFADWNSGLWAVKLEPKEKTLTP